MTDAFLKSVADYIHVNYKDNVENLCIVLPNKRGALFLKNHLAQAFGKTIWLPSIISAEDLITELSGLKTLEEIDLICHLYESYRHCYGANAETFESFAKWGQLILQDFNEIDRYLADSEQLYENLKDIKEIENWSLGAESLSEYQNNYLKFMNSLGAIYKHFSSFLLANNWAYQGLAYKTAVTKFENNNYLNQFEKLIFCGFNALNAAELKIYTALYKQKKAELLWDADNYYLKNPNQEAGFFLRNNFDLFQQREPSFISDNFKEVKDIKIISVPKQIGQAMVVKQSIQRLIDAEVPLDKVAIVLANEKLLWPVLQQLPVGVEHVNITMEYPLKYTSTYGWIDILIQLQLTFSKQKKTNKTIYHKDLINLLRHPLFQSYTKEKKLHVPTSKIIDEVKNRNLSFISQKILQELFAEDYQTLRPLLQPALNVTQLCDLIIDGLQTLITYFTSQRGNNAASLELEYLQVISRNFNRLGDLLSKYTYFNDLPAFKQLYNQVVGNATAPFLGEPLQGLQIMGVLETRTLDFEYVILVNVNEGVLPSGKTINSFIPNDLKRAFGLPLYAEKDAIYAYHFYRLLQRAKEITITYDSETDTFGKGEKSRFITQLQLEMKQFNPAINITEQVATRQDFQLALDNTICIQKDEAVLSAILSKAMDKGQYGALSPSGLIAYKECSLKFYFRYAAKIKETKEVEESAEANTFGSILHLSLENIYRPFKGGIISADGLNEQLTMVDQVVNESFISFFDQHEPVGKSILQQEAIKVYVKKLVKNDVQLIKRLEEQNQFLTLNSLEQEFSAPLEIKIGGQTTTIYIKGKVDRIDSYGGRSRIIDYKSSIKASDKFPFENFEALFQNTDYNKQFQLIIYAWLLYRNSFCDVTKIQPCIIPFKDFEEEPKYILLDKKPLQFTNTFLEEFETELKLFIESIFDRSVAFKQSDDKDAHIYCPYNSICNFVT